MSKGHVKGEPQGHYDKHPSPVESLTGGAGNVGVSADKQRRDNNAHKARQHGVMVPEVDYAQEAAPNHDVHVVSYQDPIGIDNSLHHVVELAIAQFNAVRGVCGEESD